VFTLNRKRAADVARRRAAEPARLAAEVRQLAGVAVVAGGAPPPMTVHRSVPGEGYRTEVISVESEPGIQLPALLLTPQTPGPKPAVLVADSRPKQETAAPGGDLDALAKAGYVVLAVQTRGVPEAPRSGRGSGGNAAFRAFVVGKTLPGMRADDILRAMDYLASRPDVARDRISAFGQGAQGTPLLYAALLDPRIGRVVIQDSLALYRLGVERQFHRILYEVAVPGALRSYDLDDVAAALAPRSVTLLNPLDPEGNAMPLDELRKMLGPAAERVRLATRGPADPLAGWLK
jgi:hypothetical protein